MVSGCTSSPEASTITKSPRTGLRNRSPSRIPIFLGTGYQASVSRWGDYSAMSVDPVDDCTFWYTNEYRFGNHRAILFPVFFLLQSRPLYVFKRLSEWHLRVSARRHR